MNEVACSSTACLRRRPEGDYVVNMSIVEQLAYNSIINYKDVNPAAGGPNHEKTRVLLSCGCFRS